MKRKNKHERQIMVILFNNPSIGIILCKDADMEVVRYALNRSMSPTMVALYKEQLQVGGVIQRSLEEFCRFVNEGKQ